MIASGQAPRHKSPGSPHHASLWPWMVARADATIARDRDTVADPVFEAAVKRHAERIDRQLFRRDRHAQKSGIVLIVIFEIEVELGILLRPRRDRRPRIVAVVILL